MSSFLSLFKVNTIKTGTKQDHETFKILTEVPIVPPVAKEVLMLS
jgi:hypothetical protein